MKSHEKCSSGLDIDIREQFTFFASDKTLARLLVKLADRSINIAAIMLSKDKSGKNFVRLVPGDTDSQTKETLHSLREILEGLHIHFKQEAVIAFANIPAGVPGTINEIFGILWCRTEVKALYNGENDSLYISVSNIRKALEALSEKHIRRCSSECTCCE
ncbi:hypothetical protein [Bacillus infantis]|uniref:hypothetical protein n=1 Tax=Bacillus infantis TaxID=324767 RepID=UPI003CEFF625